MEFSQAIKQATFTSIGEMALLNLWYTSNMFRDSHQRLFTPHGIKMQHYNVLRIVNGQHPKPVSPGYILEVMLDKGRDLTRLVDKLVLQGYLERGQRKDNKRKMAITITPEGRELVEEVKVEIKNWVDSHNKLSDEEAETLNKLLDKMRG